MEEVADRIVGIDNIKGLLLLLNCTSHIMLRPWIVDVIVRPTSTYYVPLFIFISGYLCKPKPLHVSIWGGHKSLLYKRLRTLIVPYFFFSIFALINGIGVGEDINSMLWQMLYEGRSCHAATPMYFVALLFMVSLTFTWVTWNKVLSKLISLTLIVIGLMLFWFYLKDLPVKLPWYLNDLPFYGSFFLSGFMVGRIIEKYKMVSIYYKTKSIFVLFAGMMLLIGIWGLFNPIKGTLLALVCPVCLISSIIFIINTFNRVDRFFNTPQNFLVFIAVNGIVVLGAHNFLNGYYHYVLKHFGITLNEWVSFASTFIIMYGTLYYFLVPFMNRYLYKVLGK